jgi:hypothetical protein
MATDRDEQLRQQQELEEIRRSFAEMGARMGSLFDPAEPDEPEPVRQPATSAATTAPAPPGVRGRPRRWWAGMLALLFVAGTAFGWILPKDGDGSDPPAAQAAPTTEATEPPTTATTRGSTLTSVVQVCVEAAQLADEVISALNRNQRNDRLALTLRDWSIANQACRREASP